MKSKKLISLLCAAALSASAFAGMVITSSAAEPVWTYEPTGEVDAELAEWTRVHTGQDANKVTLQKDDDGDSYIKITNTARTSEVYMELPEAAQLSDDYVVEFDTAIHPGNGMGRLAQYNQVAVLAEDAALDSNNYGGDYAAAATAAHPMTNVAAGGVGTWSSDTAATGVGYMSGVAASITARLELAGKWIVNRQDVAPSLDETGFEGPDSEWMRVRAEVKDGKAKITIATTQGKLVDGVEYEASTSPLSKISAIAARGDGNFVADDGAWDATGPGVILLDNIKVYNGIASAPAFSTSDLRGEPAIVVIPEPEKAAGAAPSLTVPERLEEDSLSVDFEDETAGQLVQILDTGAAGYDSTAPNKKELAGGDMYVTAGARSGGDSASYASLVQVDNGSKAVKLVGGKFAPGGGRSPMLHLANNLPVSEENGTAVMAFAVYLSKASDSNKARVWLVDADAEGKNVKPYIDDSESAAVYYKSIFAMISAEDETKEPDNAFGGDVEKNNKVIRVEPDKWHVITVAVSTDKYRVFVDGEYADESGRLSPKLDGESVGYGDDAGYMPVNLPVIAVDNATSDPSYSKVLIDNVVAYYSDRIQEEDLPIIEEGEQPSEPTATPAPTATPTPAPTLIPSAGDLTIAPVAVDATTVTVTGEVKAAAKLIHASYDATGALESVELKDVPAGNGASVEITAAKAGDKIMIWNALSSTGMNPAADVVIVAAAAE